jgi:Domain of unknown function (DUF4384)
LSRWLGSKDDPNFVLLERGIKRLLGDKPVEAARPIDKLNKNRSSLKVWGITFGGTFFGFASGVIAKPLTAAVIAALVAVFGFGGYLAVSQIPMRLAPPGDDFSKTSATGATMEQSAAQLQDTLRPVTGRVRIDIKGGPRVRLGQSIVVEAEVETSGRLIIIDINAERQLMQIFPNAYIKEDLVARVVAGSKITIPGPDYGFDLRASEVGRGTLIALVVPVDSSVGLLANYRDQQRKGFQPIIQPSEYLAGIARQFSNETGVERAREDFALKNWAIDVLEYEIVR